MLRNDATVLGPHGIGGAAFRKAPEAALLATSLAKRHIILAPALATPLSGGVEHTVCARPRGELWSVHTTRPAGKIQQPEFA